MVKRLMAWMLYATGLLAVFHRWRNRRALTVVSLHRVLAETDPRWQTCDPLYTVSDRLFGQCLEFFRAHYSIVSLDDVIAARRGARELPPRPLLLTFDDGWADNFTYALPVLQRFNVPAALFVAADAIDRHEAFFQERLIGAWRRGALRADELRELWLEAAPAVAVPLDLDSERSLRSLIARLQALPLDARARALQRVAPLIEDASRHMLTTDELRQLRAAGIGIGTHGKLHEPMTAVADLDAELGTAKALVARSLGVSVDDVCTLSFPFSKQNAEIVRRARSAGYALMFGGGLSLTPVGAGVPDLLARVGVTAYEVTDSRGNLRPDRLAASLFRRPLRRLEAA